MYCVVVALSFRYFLVLYIVLSLFPQTKSISDSGQFKVREELDKYQWYWGHMSRADSEAKMKEEGELGNFAIRVNASGYYIMTFW